MTAAIDAATKRYLDDTSITDRLAREARQFANQARTNHPLGYEEIDKQIRDGLGRASQLPTGGEQLLVVEKLHADMRARVTEADGEIERQLAAHRRRNLEVQLEAGRAAGRRAWNDRTLAPMRKSVGDLRERLNNISIASTAVVTDEEYLATLVDVEEALRSVGNMVGLERRAARLRESERRAAETTETFAKAA